MKRLTHILDKALNAVLDIEPEFTPSQPSLRIGQNVAVYQDAAHGRLICYGKIVGQEPNIFDDAWRYDIQPVSGNGLIQSWGWQIREVGPEEARQTFILIRNRMVTA